MLSGCFFEKIYEKKVSTFEELIKCKDSNANIKLTADIDCNYEIVNRILCNSIDGNGHTIKNFIISGENEVSMFYSEIKSIKNLVVENVKYKISKSSEKVALLSYSATLIENVTIKDSEMEVIFSTDLDYINALKLGVISPGVDSQEGPNISNCHVENVKINVSETNKRGLTMNIGFISGEYSSVEGCSVKNCQVEVEGTNVSQDIVLGGISGVSNSISNSSVENISLKAKNTFYTKNGFNVYQTPSVIVGGIAGICNNISFCQSNDIEIKAYSSGEALAGGLVGNLTGTMNQSYSNKTSIVADGFATGNKAGSVIRAIGGIVGKAKKAIIKSSFAYDVTLNDLSGSSVSSPEQSYAAGLVGKSVETEISNCASKTEYVNAAIVDEFIGNSCEIEMCYITSHENGNVCNCEEIDINFWTTHSDIKEKLKLMGGYWKYEDGKVPYLSI